MSTKHRAKPKSNSGDIAQRIERGLERGQIKQALKDAKAAYAADACAELRGLLERAYVARAQELVRENLRPQAEALMKDLLSLGITLSTLRPAIGALLAALGMAAPLSRMLADADPESRASLMSAAADHGVANGLSASSLPAEIAAETVAVQRALALVQQDQDAQAQELLKDIPRQSPLADWKLFVRGWSAFRRGQAEEMSSNWQRLSPERLPARAARLVGQLQPSSEGAPAGPATSQSSVARLLQDQPQAAMLADLRLLRADMAQSNWKQVVAQVRRNAATWRKLDPAIAARVENLVYTALIRQEQSHYMLELARGGLPLPLDPHWNRARALVAENPQDYEPMLADRHWRAYVVDLDQVEVLSPEERRLAKALVWLHLGKLLAEEVDYEDEYEDDYHADFDEADNGAAADDDRADGERDESDLATAELPPESRMQRAAVACFRNSLALAPDLLSAYRGLAETYFDWDRDEQALAVYRELLARFPEDFDTLKLLAEELYDADDPLAAGDYVRRAHRLKPLDRDLRELAWAIHINAARHCALRGEWEVGRQQFAEAERFTEACSGLTSIDACRGMFELKAGHAEQAEAYFARAAQAGLDPAPLALLTSIEARRYALTSVAVKGFGQAWRDAAKVKGTSASVAQACHVMLGYLGLHVGYPGRDEDAEAVAAYVKKNTRLKLDALQLRDVCLFLKDCPQQNKLLLQQIKKGVKNFPDQAFFHYASGEFEVRRGPYACNRYQAQQHFRRAEALAEKSTDPLDKKLLEPIREGLNFLEDVGVRSQPMPRAFKGPSPFGSPAAMLDAIRAMCEDMGMDPDKAIPKILDKLPEEMGGGGKRSK